MKSFGRFPTFRICLLGLVALSALVSCRHSFGATLQNRNVIETPDPYFSSALQPIEIPAKPIQTPTIQTPVNPPQISRSYNFQPAAVSAMPNSVRSPVAPAPTRVASRTTVTPSPTTPNMTKPIKGPVVLAPLEPQSIWSPPNTPVTTSPVTQTPVNNTTPVANTALAPVTNTFQQQQFSALQPQQQQPINGFSPAPIPLQNPGRPTTSGATAPVGPMQTAPQAFVSPPIAPNSIIREQRAPIQTNPSPIQTSPTKASPAQQIRDSFNSIKETFQIQKKDSAQSLQSNDNDFIPKAPLIQNVQTATAPQAQTPSQPEKIHKASTIASEVALADFGESPSQQLIKQAGFVEPTTTPVTKQDDFSVPFEAVSYTHLTLPTKA